MALMEALVQTGLLLLPKPAERWTLAEFAPAAKEAVMPLESPRTDRLNAGASGAYLVQGEGASCFNLASHVPTVTLAAVDAQEARVISCEQNLSTRLLWPYRAERALPFIFSEEYYAYRAYGAYCQQQGLKLETLPPALVGLCRDPDSLLAFALVGLVEGRIVAERREGREVWVVTMNDQSYELAERAADSRLDFLGVAHAWLQQTEPSFRCYDVSDLAEVEAKLDRIGSHALSLGMKETELYAGLMAVVGGAVLLSRSSY
jgi:hypothetical protein